MAATITGAAVNWGIPATETYGAGFIVSDSDRSAKLLDKEILDEAGAVSGHVTRDIEYMKKFTLIRTSGTEPTVGTVITINSIKYLIKSVTVKWTRDSEEVTDIETQRWAGITLT